MRTDFLEGVRAHEQLSRLQDYARETVSKMLNEAIKDDMDGWDKIGGTDYANLKFGEDTSRLREESQIAYYRKPHGRGIIRTFVKFIIGAGVVVDFSEKDPEKLKAIIQWWKKFTKNIKWFSFIVEIVRRAFRDGEVFILKVRRKERNKTITFRFVDPAKIPDKGIHLVEGDAETVESYDIEWSINKRETIPAADMIHFKLDADRNMPRGRPALEVQFPLLTKFAKWLDARMVLNYIRTSVALVREVQGSPMDLARLRGGYQANRSTGGETNKMKTLRPGSILSTTAGSKWSMLSPNLDARDAAMDGRNLQLAMAAASGLPDVFVTGDYAQSNFACHSEETEVLTDQGWMFFSQITINNRLATRNPQNGYLEFQKAQHILSFPYDGDLYFFEGKRTSFAVTPNHEMIVAPYRTSKKYFAKNGEIPESAYAKTQIQELNPSGFYLLPVRVKWEGRYQEKVKIFRDMSVDTDLWMEFIGYVITDGCITESKNSVEIGQETGWKADKIERCLHKLQIPFRKKFRPTRGKWKALTIFQVGNNDFRQFLCQSIGTIEGSYSTQKHLPEFIWDLCPQHLHCLLDALIFGDGGEYKRHPGSTQRVFNTTSPRLADEVQRLALMLGFATKLSVVEPQPSYEDGYDRHRCFRIHIGDSHPQILKAPLIQKEHYSGTVWCATVPNGSLITRLDGKPLISGNSTVVSQNPAIREFEMAQNLFIEVFSEIIDEVLADGIEKGIIPATKQSDSSSDDEEFTDIDLGYEIKYPPLIKRDLATDTSAHKTMNEAGVLSKRTWALLGGLNPDTEFTQIEDEGGPPKKEKTPADQELTADPTINHRKAIAPKSPADRRPRQNVKL